MSDKKKKMSSQWKSLISCNLAFGIDNFIHISFVVVLHIHTLLGNSAIEVDIIIIFKIKIILYHNFLR